MKKAILQLGIKGYRLLQRQLNASSVGVKGLVINPNNEILLVEHTYCEGWYFPGGGVKSGETPLQALARELNEETGLIISEPKLFGIYYQNMRGINDYPILFIIKQFTIKPIKLPNLEIKQLGWFPLNQLPKTVTPCTLRRIHEVFEGIPKDGHW